MAAATCAKGAYVFQTSVTVSSLRGHAIRTSFDLEHPSCWCLQHHSTFLSSQVACLSYKPSQQSYCCTSSRCEVLLLALPHPNWKRLQHHPAFLGAQSAKPSAKPFQQSSSIDGVVVMVRVYGSVHGYVVELLPGGRVGRVVASVVLSSATDRKSVV